MAKILTLLGLPYMDTTTFLVVGGLAFAAAAISGWIADLIMDQHSFGISVNGMLLIIGGVFGLFLLKYSGFQYPASFVVIALTSASVSAVGLLLFAAFLRRFL
jgi:uncharacterized membrane protein YeaQ/YmgE (transglycosylase-associated protein family)